MQLSEFIDQAHQEEQETGFEITDESGANWALRKIKEAKDKQVENTLLAEKEIATIEMWLDQQNKKLADDIEFFQSHLATYAHRQREENPKFKSKKLPYGTLRFKKQQPAYKYDDDALVEYLKKQDKTDLINVKYTPKKAEIKKLFVAHEGKLINPETGEFVDGVTIEERPEKFEVVTE